MKTVLHLSPFPDYENCTSGGLIRIKEIRTAYTSLGYHVIPCHFVTRDRDVINPRDIKLMWIDRIRRKHWGKPKNTGQMRLSWATRRTTEYSKRLINSLSGEISIIQIEHPWLIDVAKTIKKSTYGREAKIVYSSHNVEHILHASIWGSTPNAKMLVDEIRAIEIEAIRNADVCWAVTASDAKWLNDQGSKQTIVVPNGCRHLSTKETKKPLLGQYVLFIGGSFKPNIDGFMEWVGAGIDSISKEISIVIAGDAGRLLSQHPNLIDKFRTSNLINAGKLSDQELDRLISHASSLILPISSGSGSNLKTAEALCSGKPIIATEFSFRGFEHWKNAANVKFAENANEFCRLINETLNGATHQEIKRPGTEELFWDAILSKGITQTSSLLLPKE